MGQTTIIIYGGLLKTERLKEAIEASPRYETAPRIMPTGYDGNLSPVIILCH